MQRVFRAFSLKTTAAGAENDSTRAVRVEGGKKSKVVSWTTKQ